MTALRPDVVADLREENARLLAELRDARDRQAGSAEILRAIADASGDAERSLQQIAETTARLFDASSVTLNIASGDEWARMIRVGPSSQRVGSEVSGAELRIGGRNLPGTVFRENRQIHIPDLDNLDPAFADWLTLPHARAAGARAMAGTPLRREGKAVGALVVHRDRPVPFTDEELALLQSFADQAVIAIQNARLFNETREALERQTATADILKIIASSPSDVQPVFEAIAESANRLIGGYSTSVFSFVDDVAHLAAFTPTNPAADAALKASFPRPLSTQPWAEQIRDGEIVHVPDIETDPAVPANLREVWRMRGFHGLLVVPLRRDRASIGMIAVTRAEPGSFAAHHVQLLHTFADQAVIAIENTRLFNETREALERQTATADILKVIASSPSDVQPVFEAIASSANRLLGGFSTAVFRFVDDAAHLAAFTPTNPAADELLKTSFPLPFANYAPLQLAQNGETVQFADTETAPDFQAKIARARGFRSILLTPLMSNGAAIGLISVTRVETGSFADHHVQLLQTFAAQAVIAIENVRLFNETREALERQTATADILKVIASSPSDVQPVFAAIAASANRLIGGFSTAVFRFVDGVSHLAAFTPTHPAADEILRTSFPRPLAEFQPFELAYKGEPVQIADTETYFDARIKDIARARGFRSMLFSPLMSNGAPIGLISVTRLEPGTFAAHHVQLLQTFADQAVIAIENVRLFEEVQAKTSDLSEALQQQTATADVLKVISRSAFDLDTVMNTLARSAAELCTADLSGLFLRDGEFLALRGISDAEVRVTDFLRQTKVAIDDQSYMGRSMLSGTIANVPDFDRDTTSKVRTFQQALGFKAMLIVPLMREGRGVGVFALCRNRVGAFSQRQIELVQTFADQAVIAIENVRLFDEVQARTRELTESLEYQTATGEVLNVISRSPNNLQPVMDTIVHTTRRLCQSEYALMLHRDDARVYRIAAHSNASQELMDWMQDNPVLAGDGSAIGITAAEKQTVHLPDALADPRFTDVRRQRQSKGRTMLGVPLLRGQEVIGVVLLVRTEVKPFSNKQIDLVTNFADQAVIAIENVRLFDEVQAKTRELSEALIYQTGSSNILGVIASSPTDVGPVLKAIVESACELCEADDALVVLRDGDELVFKAQHGSIPVVWQRQPVSRDWTAGRAVVDRKPVHVHDLLAPEGEEFPDAREFARRTNVRTVLSVPLLRENESIGSIVLRRTDVRPFSDKQIALLQTFADQAVIALGNVRLFEEVQARTNDLQESLEYQTATSDVLQVISRSTFDLQPVLETLVKTAARLCEADSALISNREGEAYRVAATFSFSPEYDSFIRGRVLPAGRGSIAGRVALDGQVVHIADIASDPEYTMAETVTVGKFRTMLGVPLLREGIVIGTINLGRQRVQPFTDRQIELIRTFADQAVIAIENVRLFDEVQQRTKELSQSLDDLRTAQDRLVQTEKLASLGQLTAGIAHEIKNPLNFVNNFSALSAELTDELNDALKPAALNKKIRGEVDELTRMLKGNLEKVVLHGKRADSIVKNMLLHSREGSGERRPTDINALLDEGLNLAYHGARAEKPQFNVTLQRDFDEKAGTVELFPQEITRAFLNLISNGFYAATKRKAEIGNSGFEPTLRATTRNLGDAVEIRIRDNGTGIPTEVKEKMFNPFFTTKPAGEGTGLGLSMSHDIIVKQHGGTIDVETEPGQFTEFTIVLPRTSNIPNKTRGQT
jgi:GAF domain-containing protein